MPPVVRSTDVTDAALLSRRPGLKEVVDRLAQEFLDVHTADVVEVHVYATYRALRPHLRATLLDYVESWSRQQLFARAFPGVVPEPSLAQMLCAPTG
jgi:hypothetical protein